MESEILLQSNFIERQGQAQEQKLVPRSHEDTKKTTLVPSILLKVKNKFKSKEP